MSDNIEPGKIYTEAEVQRLRAKIMDEWVIPQIREEFQQNPHFKSAELFLRQGYDDESHDAIFYIVAGSELATLDLDEFEKKIERGYGLEKIERGRSENFTEVLPERFPLLGEKKSREVIYETYFLTPAFAAFCSDSEGIYSSFAIFRRAGEEIGVEYVGIKHRPWLEGICPWGIPGASWEERRSVALSWLEDLEPNKPAFDETRPPLFDDFDYSDIPF